MLSNQQINIRNLYRILLFIVLAYFPIFLHLEVLPLRMWDEARLAISACEMNQSGNYLVIKYEEQPDMWSTKPPVMIWMQVFFIKIFGTSELAIRLPSALAAFFTAVVIMLFAIRYLKNYWYGLIAVLILVTSYGYINTHAVRTGDYDSLLTLFTTSYCIAWFLFLHEAKRKYIHLFFIALTLAVLTKSVQALIFIPALGIYLVIEKKTRQVFNNKWFYIDMLFCLTAISSYYLLREHYNHGYLKAVWENELGGRFMSTIENHSHPFMFYFNQLVSLHFTDWYWLIPCGVVIGFVTKDEAMKRIILFSMLVTLTYWLWISVAKTKIAWYDLPMYPFLSLTAAAFLYWIFSLLKDSPEINSRLKYNMIPYVFLFVVFLHPYEKIIDKIYFPVETEKGDEYNISYFIKDAVKSKRSIKNNVICYDGHKAHLAFYVIRLNQMGQHVTFKDWHDLQSGETVIASQYHVQQYIESHYANEIINTFYNVKTYKLEGRLVILRAANNKYVCVDEGSNHNVLASKNDASSWETFSLLDNGNNRYSFKSREKFCFLSDPANDGKVMVRLQPGSHCESFQLISVDNNHVALKTANGKFWTLDEKSLHIFAKANSITNSEKFILTVQ